MRARDLARFGSANPLANLRAMHGDLRGRRDAKFDATSRDFDYGQSNVVPDDDFFLWFSAEYEHCGFLLKSYLSLRLAGILTL
jgi:hypothetical protein